MSRSIVRDLIFPSCKIFVVFLVADVTIGVIAALLSNGAYALRMFLDVSMLEGAVMMVIGPALLFRAKTFTDNMGSRILLTGFLLFLLSLVLALIRML